MIRKLLSPTFFYILPALLISCNVLAQVGINTTAPEGVLDVRSTTQGVVLPRFELTATNVMAPATNPNPNFAIIPQGTTVFNTNVSATGSNDVTVGIYTWDGSKWVPQFNQKQSEIFESDTFSLRSQSNAVLTVTGINGSSFTANYTGTYRVRVSVNYGGGGATEPDEGNGGSRSDGFLNIARQSGTFNLQIGSNTYSLPVHSYSTSYDPSVGATNYFAIWQEFNTTFYEDYTETQVLPISMTFTQDAAPEYVNDGESGSGRGYVAYDIPCTVEITYIGEQ